MPNAPRKPCAMPACGELVEHGKARCERHRRDQDRDARIRRPHEAFYDSRAWRRLSARVLAEEPICQGWPYGSGCGKPTTIVDHIVALQDGGARMERSNCRALDRACHGDKTQWEIRNRRRAATPGGTSAPGPLLARLPSVCQDGGEFPKKVSGGTAAVGDLPGGWGRTNAASSAGETSSVHRALGAPRFNENTGRRS